MGSFMWLRGVLPREDGMIHGALLPLDHHMVSIDFMMDDYRDYNLPYERMVLDV
jgi:hypothetical protein